MKLAFPILNDNSWNDLCRLKYVDKHAPCVYTFLSDGVPVYVGKTNSIWTRLNTHLNLDKWLFADSMKIEVMNSRVDMDLYELQLINKYKPVLNKAIPEGELTGVVDIVPKEVINLVLCERVTTLYRKIRKMCDENGFTLLVSCGTKRVYFKISGKLTEKGKLLSTTYSYKDSSREFLFHKRSGRKVFDESVRNAIIGADVEINVDPYA